MAGIHAGFNLAAACSTKDQCRPVFRVSGQDSGSQAEPKPWLSGLQIPRWMSCSMAQVRLVLCRARNLSQHLLENFSTDFSSSTKSQTQGQKRSQGCDCQMQGWRKQLCKHLVPVFSFQLFAWTLHGHLRLKINQENTGVECDLFSIV